jgi:dATP pyrophosphohydrolase
MTDVRVLYVDVYLLRPGASGGYEALCLRRAPGTRCAGAWETIHGHLGENEPPAAAARRELREETGLTPVRLFNLSRVEQFYVHRLDVIALIPVFVAFVPAGAQPRLSGEHDGAAWLPPQEAARRYAWPRERRALADAVALLGTGGAGALEDVLGVD